MLMMTTKDERFVSRYIANAIYCIIWKYRDIAIFRKYRDILTIFIRDFENDTILAYQYIVKRYSQG